MARKKTTKKTAASTEVAEPETTTKKASTKKAATKKAATKKVGQPKAAPIDPADIIWADIKDLPINMYAMVSKVEDHVLRVHGVPDKLCVKFKSGAALPALETTLSSVKQTRVERTATGDPVTVEYPKYELEETDLFVIVKPFVPAHERPEAQVKTGPFVVVPSGKPY